jgi:hypothetical protein
MRICDMSVRPCALGILAMIVVLSCDQRPQPAESPPSTPHTPQLTIFREASATTGLEFEHFLGSTGEYYFPETTVPGVAVFDYDSDGDLDVYLLQGSMLDGSKSLAEAEFPPPQHHWPGNRLYRNELVPEGTLRFTDVSEETGVTDKGYGMGAAVGDYDNDGDPDIYVTNFGSNVLLRNEGGANFTNVTAAAGVDDERWSASSSFVDYDLDGDLDLFVTNYVDFTVAGARPCAGTTGERDYCGPQSYEPVPDRLFRNDGDGTFTEVTASAGLHAAFGSGLGVISADFDDDGWPDLYVTNDQLANQLWRNRGDGTFEDISLMSGTAVNANGQVEASMGVTAGDFDQDGDEDLFMTHINGETNTLYLNAGNATFVDVTHQFQLASPSRAMTSFGTLWFDFDNDTDLDLFIANGAVKIVEELRGTPYPFQQKNQLLRSDGDGHVRDISAEAGSAMELFDVSRGAAFGDIDNDGDVDIVVSNANGPARLMINEIGNRQNWLSVELEGTASNRDGFGARVTVLRNGDTPLRRRAHTDGSYLSASDARVHFGLGSTDTLDGVLVHWPSGVREIWREISPNSFVHLREGSGEPVESEFEDSH